MATTTDRIYGRQTAGVGRTVQEIGLCNLAGQYVYTAKLRAKGLLVVVFFSMDSEPSVTALKAVQAWTKELPTEKWSVVALAEGSREQLKAFSEKHGLDGITILVDNELYHTRAWGVSYLPSLYLISGKSGKVVVKLIGDDADDLRNVQQTLQEGVSKLVEAEAAAKKAEEEKKAADAAAKK